MSKPDIKIILVFAFLLCAMTICATAQETTIHPIDTAQTECSKAHPLPRTRCSAEAIESWEKDIIRTYIELLRKTPSENKRTLEKAQSAWEKYREAEFDYIAKISPHPRGGNPASVSWELEIVKTRALRLEKQLTNLPQ